MLLWLGVLQQYRITTVFTDSLDIPNRPGTVAMVKDDYPYCTIEILYKRSHVDGADLEQICELTLHEILHVLLFSPLERCLDGLKVPRTQTLDLEEESVDKVTLWLAKLQFARGDNAWEL